MAYNVDNLSTIYLGQQGENLAQTVEINVESMLSNWPDAHISLVCQRNGDADPYVAVTEVRDGILLWPITSVETAVAGVGRIEIRAMLGDVIAKSVTVRTMVRESMTGNVEAEPPEAMQGWVDQVLQTANAASDHAARAEDAAERAEIVYAEAEAERARAEAIMGENESRRVYAEIARENAESQRNAAEESRVQADAEREAGYETAMSGYENAIGELQKRIANGEFKGDPGNPGYTPVRGTDYWTDADKAEIHGEIDAAVRTHGADKDAHAELFARKVDAVDGKGLSTNDYTDEDKEKLDALENYTLPAATDDTLGGVMVDDGHVCADKMWHSQQIIDALCPPFAETGNPVTCHPVAGSPLNVKARVEPKQHLDWVSRDGESTQVTTTGRNLCDIGTASFLRATYIPIGTVLQPGTYTFSADVSSTDTDSAYCRFAIFTELKGTELFAKAISRGKVSETFTINEAATYIYLYASIGYVDAEGDTATFSDIQIEPGSIAHDYEPYTGGQPSPSPDYPQDIVDSVPAGSYYVPSTAPVGGYWRVDLDEALGGVGEYKDALEIDAYTGRWRIVRKTALVVLDGTETIERSNYDATDRYDLFTIVECISGNANSLGTKDALCSTLLSMNINQYVLVDGIGGWGSVLYIRCDSVATTVPDFKSYLSTQYASGVPFTIRYALAEPIITTGQAVRVTSTAGLTALDAVSMGLTAPDPEHPCEITVPDTVRVQRCGKNLVKNAFVPAQYDASNGTLIIGSGSGRISDYIRIDSTKTYCAIWATVEYVAVLFFDADKKLLGRTAMRNDGKIVVTFPMPITHYNGAVKYAAIYFGSQPPSYDGIQLELVSTPTPYEPYHGDTYDVALPEGFDGGDVDVSTGEATEQWKKLVLDGTENWLAGEVYYVLWGNETSLQNGGESQICSHYKTKRDYSTYGNLFVQTNGAMVTGGSKSVFLTIDDWKAYLAAEHAAGHPVTIYYKLATPVDHNILPTPIPALAGTNTITTDADALTVEGRADPVRIIAEQTETIAGLIQRVSALESAATK